MSALALFVGATALAIRRADRHLRAELLLQVRMVAAAIDGNRVKTLTGSESDLDSPDYRYLKDQFAAIRAAHPKCRFMYLMGRKPDGRVMFLLDAEPETSPDFSPPGQIYEEATAALLRVFTARAASVEGPISDRWGSWVSALTPLPGRETGAPPIVLGMDIDATGWRGTIAAQAALPAALAAVAVMLGLLAIVLQRNRREIQARQEELRENQRQLKNLVDFLPDATFAIDRNKRVILWNRAIEKMTGLPAGEMIGKGDYAYSVPFYGEARPQLMDLVLGASPEVADRYPRLTREGDTLMAEVFCAALDEHRGAWVYAKASPLRDAAGNVVGAIESIRDITQRKAAEEALLASENKLSTLFGSMGEMAVLHELVFDGNGKPVDYRLTDCNAAFTRTTGIPKENAVGKLATAVYGTATAPYLEEYAQVAMSGIPRRFETYFAPLDKYFLISAVPLGKDRFATLSDDVTERHRSEEQVRKLLDESNRARQALLGILEDHNRSEADLKRLATAIDQAAETIVVTDAQGTIQYVNPTFEAVTGYTRAEAIGQNPRILQSGRQDAAFYRDLWATLSGGRTWRGRLVNKRKDGTLFTEDAVISPVCDASGQIVNFVAVKHDVSEQLRLAEQLMQIQKLDSIGRLAGGVAHDFNNMLTVILGHAGMALDQTDPAQPVQAHLEEIRKAANRSADLTRQLLAFARKQTIVPRVLDLNQTVEGMLNMLKRLIGENIALDWRPQRPLWPIRMDPSQIDQILVNLCVNARDAIAGIGQITIATQTATLDEAGCAHLADAAPGDYDRISVQDNGCGMDAGLLAHIFEPFFTSKAAGEGTGLGLSTVYGIVRQNNGFLDVHSEPGQGTTFHIYLPRFVDPDAPKPAEASPPIPRGSETLLLVEDDLGILEITAQMLTSLGYVALSAGTPEQAFRLAEEHAGQIQLLVTDAIMPRMNGRDLAYQLQALYPAMKCLFMSGYTADVIARNSVLNAGVNFIPKPFSKLELAAKIREMLDSEKG